MERACEYDNKARENGVPAMRKIQLLPKVVSLLNRTSVQDAVLDPDTNFLQHVKFFLEPLNDGSLPAYNIQRDIFKALVTLPIEKEVLLSSGIGKVVLFYTQSKRPEIQIKRMAERLVGEWSRPLLKRTDDYRKRRIETREFDYEYVSFSGRPSCFHCLLTSLPHLQRPQGHPAHRLPDDSHPAPLEPVRSPGRARPHPRCKVDVEPRPPRRPARQLQHRPREHL